MLQVLGKASSINVRKVLWVCHELEITYELPQWGSGRWLLTPMDRPALPAVSAYYERLSERPGYLADGRNGIP